MARNGNRTFIKVTNIDIYAKLTAMELKLEAFCEQNKVDHVKINGNLALNKYMAVGGVSIAVAAVYWIWQHVMV